MAARNNPFALVRAADYTDAQINSLWVELGTTAISAIIEPTSGISKYILGGRGSGKTHLLRYHSYPVARLRYQNDTGMAVVARQKFLAVFLRATALDAARFEAVSDLPAKWQQLFGVYLELRLVEGLLDALCDIKSTTPRQNFDDRAFLKVVSEAVVDPAILAIETIEAFRAWIVIEKKKIDDAINNSAFSGRLEIRVPFSIGALCLPIKKAMVAWHPGFEDVPLLYLIDEIENFSELQQQVVNSLLRYGEGMATFRVTGRLYARKTLQTIGGGEENREGAEFKTTDLDDILKSYPKYGAFARKFVMRRLGVDSGVAGVTPNPDEFFEEIDSEDFFRTAMAMLGIEDEGGNYLHPFIDALRNSHGRKFSPEEIASISHRLTDDLPLVLRKLNIVKYCKKYSDKKGALELADQISADARSFYLGQKTSKDYINSYGHYKGDIFAQMCRESRRSENVPYAGFDTFVGMSSGNPRSLLIILSRAYEIAAFKEVDFINGSPLPVSIQTLAAIEAAHFMFDRDTNYGGLADQAKVAVERLATLLRTARYSLNIPEVSPLAVSFSDERLSQRAREILGAALNFSLLFESKGGRPDRNSHRVNRKVQLNPLLSPKWGLSIGKRGDLSLNDEMALAIFDPALSKEFDVLLKVAHNRWNNPFNSTGVDVEQGDLF